MRVAGAARGGAGNKDYFESGKDLWRQIYHKAVDSRLESMYQESVSGRL